MGLFDIDSWSEILQTISRNKKRSIMTALGIFWGIFMLIVMLGAGTGMGKIFGSALGDMSNNTMHFFANQTSVPYRGMPSDRFWRFEQSDVGVAKVLPEVDYATMQIFSPTLKCAYDNNKGEYQLVGQGPEMQKIQPQPLIFGRYINDIDMSQNRKVCVIGTQVWKDLFPGGENPEGKTIKVGPFYFTVVGVIVKKGEINIGPSIERQIIYPSSLALQLFNRNNTFSILSLTGKEGTSPKEVDRLARQAIYAQHIISPDDKKAIWAISMGDMVEKASKLLDGISLLTWVVGLGTLIAGVVGVSNIMLVLVKERTQEIGIRRALGAKPSMIITQILSESFILTFIAGVLGLSSAVGALSLADKIYYETMVATMQGPDITFQISFSIGIVSLLILVTGSLLAGIIPAYRALKIKAVDAIREE